jgi:hypothetical protein
VRTFALESDDGLVPHNVLISPAVLDGRCGLRLTFAGARPEVEQLAAAQREQRVVHQLATVKDVEFSSGVIDVELAGMPAPDAPAGARGFVGVAFRVQSDNETHDAFDLRPTNGRADDQERRNRSVQYVSLPEWPWARLRKVTPAKYESYVDLVPGQWTAIKIEVDGGRGRLFVHGSAQPTLVVNELKTGANGRGGVALWMDNGTVAHFRNLRIAPH